MIHELKQETAYFQLTIKNKKNYEIRLNDRNFAVGDYIALNEWDPIEKKYTGRSEVCEIESILNSDDFPEGLKEGYVILGTVKSWNQALINANDKMISVVKSIEDVCKGITKAINEVDWYRIFKECIENHSDDNN